MLDQIISNSIPKIQSESLTKLMIFITNMGNKYAILTFCVILLLFLMYHRKDYMKTKILILSITLGTFFSQGLKHLIQRVRPEVMLIPEGGFSFPSGHATLSMVFFGLMIYLFKDKIKNKTQRYAFITINILLIALISFSRLYLNVHWLTDVLAGLLLGLICIWGSIWISKKYLKNFNLNIDENFRK